MLIVPFSRKESDAFSLTAAVTHSETYFGYQAILVANTDTVRAWRGRRGRGLDYLWEKPAQEVLGPYASDPTKLAEAGESALSGYVERWLSDLATHWRHEQGSVPAEKDLTAAGIVIAAPTAVASAG